MNPIGTAASSTVAQPELWPAFIKSFGMLSIVIGILLVVLFLVKRFSLFGGVQADKNIIRMVASYSLAPREKVILLDVQGEKILIGVTPQNINRLAVIDKNSDWKPEKIEPETGFSKILKGAVKKVASGDKSGQTSS